MGWNGIVVPAKTPPDIINHLNTDIVAAIRSPAVQERFSALMVETITTTPERFDMLIKSDIEHWADVLNRAGVKLDSSS